MKSAPMTALLALVFSVGVCGASLAASADDCQGHSSATRLTVHVIGVRAAKGEIAVTLYPDDAARFLAPHKKLLRVRAVAQSPTTTACFWLPGPGFYAIAVYHDQNANRDFDRTVVGLPAEGFGFPTILRREPRSPPSGPPVSGRGPARPACGSGCAI